MIEQDASVGSFIITEASMSSENSHALATMAILTLVEIKNVAAAFDGGEVNLFDALDAVGAAVEAYQGEAQQLARREAA
jgi:hypothetical protein